MKMNRMMTDGRTPGSNETKKRMSLWRGGIIAAIIPDNNDTVVAVA